jgi:putative oxidoreductase
LRITGALTLGPGRRQDGGAGHCRGGGLAGLALLTARLLRPGLVVMTGWLGGMLSPVVLFPAKVSRAGCRRWPRDTCSKT